MTLTKLTLIFAGFNWIRITQDMPAPLMFNLFILV